MDKRIPSRNQPGKAILDLEELNLGVSGIIAAPGGPTPRMGDVTKLLDVTGDGRRARTMTVMMGQSFQQPSFPPNTRISGPLTGIVEFGNGAVFSRVEFDIQEISRMPDINVPPSGLDPVFKSPYFSGTALTVPGSAARVYARNDNNFPPLNDPSQIIGLADGFIDPTVFAHISYGETFGGNRNLTKTIYVVRTGTNPLTPNSALTVGIPPFAQTVSFFRSPAETTTLGISFLSFGSAASGTFAVPVSSIGTIRIPGGYAGAILIQNTTGAVNIDALQAVFELAL